MSRIILYLISVIITLGPSHLTNANNNIAYNIPDPDCTGIFNLCTDVDKERLGRQAIKTIHEQMDDDKDGIIEASESRDFIHEELESKTDSIRHSRFQNADLQISIDDLWKQWKSNPVYNWTNDDVIHWLVNQVHLPIYVEYFRRNQIDGRMIPRLAANEKQYLSTIMQMRDPRHKRRLIIKATDVVLFGPPQRTHSFIKDMILISAVLISLAACTYAFIRHRKTQESMNIMLKELETLQKAEGDIMAATGKVIAMENELQDKTKVDRGLLNAWFLEVQRTKEEADKYRKRRDSTIDHEKQLRLAVHEIEQLRIALRKAEEHARHQSYEAPAELIDLLKRTYHIEEVAFETKRKLAEHAMLSAKEQMGKIAKMQKGFLGAVRIAHTGCMDNIGELINAAKERLADIHDEHEEREKRWSHIASLLDRHDLIGTLTGTHYSTLMESNALVNSSNESPSNSKTNSVANNRGLSSNTLYPALMSQQDSISQTGSAYDLSGSPSGTLTRRAVGSNATITSRYPTERFSQLTSIVHSNSTAGFSDSAYPMIDRQNTSQSHESSYDSRQAKPMFESIPDSQFESNDSMSDEQLPTNGNGQLTNLSSDDRRSTPSLGKTRKPLISSKLFKTFANMRSRKKSDNA